LIRSRHFYPFSLPVFLLKGKSVQGKLQAGWAVPKAGPADQRHSWKGRVVHRKQSAGAAMRRFNQGELES